MKTIYLFIFCLFLTSCGTKKKALENNITPTEKIAEDGATQIKNCFENYKSSLLNDKAEEAYEYIDSRTSSYYSEILKKSISADSTEIENLKLMDKLMVFSIRHRTPKEKILSFDGKQLFIYAIQEGMISKNNMVGASIGEVTIDNDFAKGQLNLNGNPLPAYFHNPTPVFDCVKL